MEKLQELPKDIQRYIIKFIGYPKPKYIDELNYYIDIINNFQKIHRGSDKNIPSLLIFFIDLAEYNDGLFLQLYN